MNDTEIVEAIKLAFLKLNEAIEDVDPLTPEGQEQLMNYTAVFIAAVGISIAMRANPSD